MVLMKELDVFQKALPDLLSQGNEGKYALVHDDQVAAICDTEEQAIQAGYDRFELKPFLVKKIEAVEKPRYYSGSIRPCHT